MNRSWVVRVVEGWAIAGGCFTLAVVLVTTTNIALFAFDRIARTFGGVVSGLPGYEDFVSLTVSCAALMFIPLCQLRRGHIAIDVFTERLSKRSQHTLDRIWSVAMGLMALFLAFWMFQAWRSRAPTTRCRRDPVADLAVHIPVSCRCCSGVRGRVPGHGKAGRWTFVKLIGLIGFAILFVLLVLRAVEILPWSWSGSAAICS
jgi:TRAP-type C4-dicarboxylate transport system permease small subunit